MTTIPGASQYLGSATLANQQGRAPASASLLDGSTSATSLLDAARTNTGVGLSSRARALTKSFLSTSASSFNQIHSLATSATATDFAIQQGILALRASLPESSISPSILGQEVDEEV